MNNNPLSKTLHPEQIAKEIVLALIAQGHLPIVNKKKSGLFDMGLDLDENDDDESPAITEEFQLGCKVAYAYQGILQTIKNTPIDD